MASNEADNAAHFDIDVEGDTHGDIEVTDSSVNVTASGDGSAAAGGDQTGVATGDGSVAAGDDIEDSNIATGDGAVAFDGDNEGVINTAPEPVDEVGELELPPPEISSDADVVVTEALELLLGNEQEAVAYSQDPPGWLADHGVDNSVAEVASLGDVITLVARKLSFSPHLTESLATKLPPTKRLSDPITRDAGDPGVAPRPVPKVAPPETVSVSSVSPPVVVPPAPPAVLPPPPIEVLEQTVNQYVTEVYETNEFITQNIADNSRHVDVDVEGEVHGDLEIEDYSTNVSALGDNSAAAGGDQTGVATGDGSVAAGDDIEDSNIATGDGAVAFDGDNEGVVNTGENSGVIADGDVDRTVVGDGNTVNNIDSGDGPVQVGDGNTAVDTGGGDAVVGDENQTIQGSSDVNAGFGNGDVADFEGADLDDSQIAFGGGSNATQDNDTSIDNSVNDSFNDSSTEQTQLTDQSINDSGNTDIEDSFDTEDSGNLDIEDSFDTEDSGNVAVEQEVTADDGIIDDVEAID